MATAIMAAAQSIAGVAEPTNGGKNTIDMSVPYTAHVTIKGTADLLFHAWNVEAIEEKANAAKGSEAKKTDDLESFVYRNEAGLIVMPSEYLRMAIVKAAKSLQDPRSPRKSASDLFKAGVVALEPSVPIVNANGTTTKAWDFVHRCRVQIQRSGITRSRPAFHAGWEVTIPLLVMVPEYISEAMLNGVIAQAGRLVGVGDFRPTYGRFQLTNFKVQREELA